MGEEVRPIPSTSDAGDDQSKVKLNPVIKYPVIEIFDPAINDYVVPDPNKPFMPEKYGSSKVIFDLATLNAK